MITRRVQTLKFARHFHTSKCVRSIQPYEAGFVFDMDGVLIKGSKPIPKAGEALKLLEDRQIPWILMTNGGGLSEKQRADALSSKLGLDIKVEQIVQSHTPLITLPNKQDQTVLVIGGDRDNSRKAAQNYGFKKVLIPADFIKTNRSIWPFHSKDSLEFGEAVQNIDELPIDNILVFNDPRDLGTDIQVISDVLKRNPDTHVIFSNTDWLWSNDYSVPRFGQGVFRFILENLYKENHGGKLLNRTVLGKPTQIAYDFAHHVLINRALELHGDKIKIEPSELEFGREIKDSHLKEVFMVGDNPASDIIGGFNYGWNTLLVKTGVYKEGDELPVTPTYIGENVYDVVSTGLKRIGLY